MRKSCIFALTLAIVAVSCQKEVVFDDNIVEPKEVETSLSNTRSYDEALAIAEDALKLLEGDDTRSVRKRSIKRDEGQIVYRPVTRGAESVEEPIMYVFNNEDDEGFTVVAAARNQQALIAVTEKGNYIYGEETGVEAFDVYMDNMISTLSIDFPARPLPPTPEVPNPNPIIHEVHYDEESRVDPLVTTKWGQKGCYGAYCDNGVSGCVATAIGQIMAYHKHPEYLTMSYKDNSRVYFDWDNILQHTRGYGGLYCSCDTICHIQIASLLREIGERCDMEYNGPSSGANMEDAKDALATMGYKNAKYKEFNWNYSQMDIIKYNIDNNRPVCIAGDINSENGHAWIIDGYYHYKKGYISYSENPLYDPNDPLTGTEYITYVDNVVLIDLFHYNWGWNGDCDGWFSSTCYQMNNAYNNGGDFGFDNWWANNTHTDNYKYNLCLVYNFEPK